jgi:hypothetical protein
MFIRRRTTPIRTDGYVTLAAVAALAASFVITPHASENGPTICPFRLMTGLPCPGCGLTRSFVSTAHGDFRDAFGFHLFGPLLFVGLIVYCALGVAAFARSREWRPLERLSLRNPLFATPAALWLGWALFRIVSTI